MDEAELERLIQYFDQEILPGFRADPSRPRLFRGDGAAARSVQLLNDAGLLDARSGHRDFRLGARGREVLFGRVSTREVLESFAGILPPALKRAAEVFDRDLLPRFQESQTVSVCWDEGAPPVEWGLLVRCGLLRRQKYGSYGIGPETELVLLEMKTALKVLGEWWANQRQRPASAEIQQISNHFHEPVGAIAQGSGAVAHGTVNVGRVDQSLHELVSLQDELGALSDELWSVLRRVRELEVKQGRLGSDVLELELESFARRVRPDHRAAVLEVLKHAPVLAKIVAASFGAPV